jgi:hypothetical protein
LELSVLHRKHCALDASSDANASCNVDDAGMASGWLPSAAMVEEAKESSSSLWYIDGSMLDGLHAVARFQARQSKGVGWKDEAASASESLAGARARTLPVCRREREREDKQDT